MTKTTLDQQMERQDWVRVTFVPPEPIVPGTREEFLFPNMDRHRINYNIKSDQQIMGGMQSLYVRSRDVAKFRALEQAYVEMSESRTGDGGCNTW